MSKFKKKDPYAEREAQKYGRPIPSRELILEYLSELGRPAIYKQIQSDLDLNTPDEQEALHRRLIAMVRDGQLLKNRKGAYGPLDKMELISGRVVGHKDGFGFVEPDEGDEDLFLSPRQMRSVFHGDRVLARVSNIDTRGRREALIVEVLERHTQQLVGRFHTESGSAYVEPSNQRINQDILIAPEATHGAKHGQMVVVAIISQPDKHSRAMGEIVEVLGDHMAPGMEIDVAIRNHNLPYEWPEDVLSEATRFPAHVVENDLTGRKDFRHLPFVTIDGEDAKDFDDAVYCEPQAKSGWTLYVAIADVDYYVRPHTALDREAYQRGNSVYFPSRVIPMLPETLSNNLCSLNPDVDRLAMVCEMTISPAGKIMRYSFFEGVIQSQARLTYRQVHTVMEKNDKNMRERFTRFIPQLTYLYDLFHLLRNVRKARGAIDFDLPETKIVFGKNRKIEKIIPYERFDSHRVIEECMLCANICAARFLEKNKQPGLYRVHEGPTEEKLRDLRRFLNEMGLKMPGHREPIPADYSAILRSVQDRPDAHMIQTILLRSMSQAVYDPDNKGHFGLAFEAYAHFTSPIRRYPDLLVHRAIKKVLLRKPDQTDDGFLTKAGEHCSMTERRADDATREAIDWLKCEFMMDKVGKEYLGVISGVTSFGLFVELKDIYVEGLIHISNLPSDYYRFDPIKHLLVGERSNKRFRLGDTVNVQVARVDLDQCEIDFALANGEQKKVAGKRKLKKR
ncbi:MAG: ribonuclease R [Gammaproteobacteria bacterium RIFCSPHIGHO2_12_FULL_37_34]|nr:MAG: ribonuclease R [Gammaproteobacteria bacterium RIFCSPHIGHO2_12_FULL_37_34]